MSTSLKSILIRRLYVHCTVLTLVLGAARNNAQESLNLQGLIDEAIAAGQQQLVLPAGEYRLTPPSSHAPHLSIQAPKDLTIVADGVTLICTKLNQAIEIDDAERFTLSGLTIDYDPLPFTQGEVVGMDEQGRVLEVELDKGYPGLTDRVRVSVWTPDGTRIKPGSWTRYTGSFHEQDGRRVLYDQGKAYSDVAVGDRLVFSRRIVTPHAVILRNCSETTLRGVTVHASTTFGFLDLDGDANHFDGLRITPGPMPAGADRPRILSTLADGLHSKFARRGPTVENCVFERMGDDGIAINGDFMLVVAVDAAADRPTVTLAFKRRLGLGVGDRVLGRDRETGAVLGNSRVVSLREAEAAVVQGLADFVMQSLPQLREKQVFEQAWVFELDTPLDVQPGDLVSSPDRNGSGFVVRNNTIRNHRARGILVKASEGVIEGNTIDGSSMAGILLCPEVEFWMEADFSQDVAIRGNVLRDVNLAAANPGLAYAGAITVTAPSLDQTLGHRDLQIIDNEVHGGAGPAVYVSCAQGVQITGNRFVGTHQYPGGHGSKYGIPADSEIHLSRVREVVVRDNTVVEQGPYAGPLLTTDQAMSEQERAAP